MIDQFIDDLVADLKPKRKLDNSSLFLIGAIGFCLVLLYVIASLGIRADINSALESGVLYWKNGGLLIAAIGAAFVILKIARPQHAPKKIYLLPALIIGFLVIWQFVAQADFDLFSTNFGGAEACISTLLLGGASIFYPLWHFWVRKTAPQNGMLMGALTGIFSGAISAFAYSFHCNMDGAIYYLICYWLPILILGGIGAIIGRRLSW